MDETLPDPLCVLQVWMGEAQTREPQDPTAAALATVDAQGHPEVRMILLRGSKEDPFVFYTNLESDKGRALTLCPHAALCLYWKTLGRQVRVRGPVCLVDEAQADAYFRQRHRGSQIGAWVSQQSRVLSSWEALQEEFVRAEARWHDEDVTRPPYWSGYRLVPLHLEFWEHRPDRLHHRRLFTRPDTQTPWQSQFLYP